MLFVLSPHSNRPHGAGNAGKTYGDQQENWAPADQPVQQRRRSHYVVEVSRRCSTSSDAPNRTQKQSHCKQQQQQHDGNFTSRASQRSSSQGNRKSEEMKTTLPARAPNIYARMRIGEFAARTSFTVSVLLIFIFVLLNG